MIGISIGILALFALALAFAMCAAAGMADDDADDVERRLANPPEAKEAARLYSIAIERMRRRCEP
jgi:hypothetical protein